MWQIKIHDPSGETRILPLQGSITLGRGENASVPLRDPLAPQAGLTLWAAPNAAEGKSPQRRPARPTVSESLSPFWLRVAHDSPPAILGGLEVREAQLPSGFPVTVGETRFCVEPVRPEAALPSQPAAVRSWLTCSEEGRQILWMTKKAASTPLSIYLAGETGTGKEVLAHLLHAWSDRASGPFVPLHCGALALSLAESELFGHVKGAFTGATHHRPGALMQAHNGTLFLDEVGDLPLDIQVKLLRFLENGEIRPVGADRPSRADVRIICATHHPLQKLIEEGKFRRDLYYRLASVTIEIPALRNRPEDVELLARRFCAELQREISPRAMLRLQAHCWPGNVRELRHAIERASGLAGPFVSVLDEEAFAFLLTPENVTRTPELGTGSAVLTLKEMERVMLLKALKLARGNRATAAKILGIARSTLFEMLKRHGIVGPRKSAEEFEVA
ncbi:MAG: sigma 54-interacting transcriptional regulator [Oligoflexia bacterium]|nr:sigma 54-interacting transcriptional regulator [Oligoflexia bacterium]